ncbi:MAG: heme NO-binding domain-containing protein [Colwelliaceae bacterium]|jgi:predicted hydrocarbon binding protein|nr:heme NO-binding domain-containing protein [Colwelliaceae bacterium]
MKGSVFNGFEKFVTDVFGLEKWQEIIDSGASSTNGIYLASELYDDDEIKKLLAALSGIANIESSCLQRDFGQFIFPVLYNSLIDMLSDIDDLFDFLIAVDNVIHVEVQKLDPQAYTPTLFYDQPDENTLLIRYISNRKMCYFAEGLIFGAAEKFCNEIKVSQDCCLNEGHEHCIIRVNR